MNDPACTTCGGFGTLRVGYFANHEEFVRTGSVPCDACGPLPTARRRIRELVAILREYHDEVGRDEECAADNCRVCRVLEAKDE